MTAQEKRKKLKEILLRPVCTPCVGVYDALGAKVVEKAGFDTFYLGSYTTSASVFGFPDVMSLTLTEMTNHIKNVANSVDIPLVTDAESGFFHAANIWRTVREFEDAGAAAIHIEDHEFGKHTDLPPLITDTGKMCKKIEAAVAAKTDPNFLIIARTDVAWANHDIKDMVHRLNAYMEAGADAVYPVYFEKMTRELRDQIKGPLVVIGTPNATIKEESEAGANLSLYFTVLFYAAFYAMREAARQFKETEDYSKAGKYLVKEEELNPYIGFPDFIDRVKNYL
jgi:methylisocitrate lyase